MLESECLGQPLVGTDGKTLRVFYIISETSPVGSESQVLMAVTCSGKHCSLASFLLSFLLWLALWPTPFTSYVETSNPACQLVAVFGNRAFKVVIELK